MATIASRTASIRQRVAAACGRSGRDPAGVAVVCVTKGRDLGLIREALGAGCADIGENRVQEASLKRAALSGPFRWHMIGHLQTNKAKDAVRIFDLIHSVDSLRLCREIDRQAAGIPKVQDILLEVNVSGEESKYGIRPAELGGLLAESARFGNLRVRGLMTVAPLADDPERARPHFRALRILMEEANRSLPAERRMTELSMGMTDDFEAAIEEGATIVRIGRAIFDGDQG